MQLPYASTDAPADEDAPTSPTAAGGSHPLSGGAQTLAAVVDRLIPADEHGPGAVTAGVLDFFERQLRGQLAPLTGLYAEGLAGLDELARAEQGAPFAELSPDHQDALLEHVERLDPVGEHARLRSFFEAVLNHTIDGFLADPLYGGNRDFIGWQLIGYPGPILQPSREQQSIGPVIPLNRRSRDDFDFFSAGSPAKALS